MFKFAIIDNYLKTEIPRYFKTLTILSQLCYPQRI